MTFRRVVVAFDGSPQGEDALALALRLCDHTEGVLTLTCVVTGHRWHVSPEVQRVDAPVPDEVALMFAEARASAIPAGVHVRERAPVAPSPARGLTELAEREGADLIVIGSSAHAEAGLVRLERTAGRLLQGAPCAVAVAPGGLRERGEFRRIAVAYDDSLESRAALAVAYDIAAPSRAAVTLIRAFVPFGSDDLQREARLEAQTLLDEAAGNAPAGVNPHTVLLHGEPGNVIRDACDGIVDLLVTGSRSYGPLQRALLGSVSEAVTEGASHPVLVVPRVGSRPMAATVVAPDGARAAGHSVSIRTPTKEPIMTTSVSELPLDAYTVINALQLGLIERTADADVRSLARAMAEHSIHSVVVRGIKRPRSWGIVSDLDLMAAMRPESADATAGQLAATDPVVVEPGETLGRAAQLMAEHQTAHLVVVDPLTEEPVGILSSLDVARFMAG
jgi:nucleotide-binding universal stress UspA family protein